MARALIIIAHPDPSSLTHVTARKAREAFERRGVETTSRDLYAEAFDPRLSREEIARRYSFDPAVQDAISEVERSTHLVFAHPVWWGLPPAVMKGWIDRVFLPGVAYEYRGEEFEPKSRMPLLEGKRGLVLCGTNEAETQKPASYEIYWTRLFDYCGVDPVAFHTIDRLRNTDFGRRAKWLDEIDALIARLL